MLIVFFLVSGDGSRSGLIMGMRSLSAVVFGIDGGIGRLLEGDVSELLPRNVGLSANGKLN